MIRPQTDLTLEALAARIEALEAGQVAVAVQAASAVDATASHGASAVAEAPAEQVQPAATSAPMSAAKPAEVAAAASAAEPVTAPAEQEAQSQPHTADAAKSEPAAARVAAKTADEQPAQRSTAQLARAAEEAQPAQAAGQPAVAPNGQRAAQGAYDLANPAALQRFWQAALALIKKEKAAYHVLLLNTKLTYDAQTASLTIAFPAESDFAFKAFQKPDASAVVEKAIASAYAAPLAFSYAKLPKDASSRKAAPSATQAAVQQAAVAPRVEETPAPRAEEAPAGRTETPPAHETTPAEAPAFDDDLVPLDAYEGWSPEPARAESTSAEADADADAISVASADADAAQKELSDLKDALSLFGEGVTIEQWN